MAEMGTSPKVAQVIIQSLKKKNHYRDTLLEIAAMFMESKKMKTDIEFEEYMKKPMVSNSRLEYIRQSLIFVKVRKL